MKIFQSILALLLPLKAMACGLDWSPPVSHFEDVDYQGNVHIVRKLGEVENLPIYLIFNSSFGVSPYVGSGFEIPILESRIWQVDENRFQAKMPSGWLWIFQRTKDPSILEGSAGWKAQVKDDTITAWADCGDKIVFKNGRIASMLLKGGKQYSYTYKGNRVESIELNGKTILAVESDKKNDEVAGLWLPLSEKEISIRQFSERPKIQNVTGKNIVSGIEKSLSQVTRTDGKTDTFEFLVDDKLNPALITKNTTFTWNSGTKKVAKAGEWTYTITPEKDRFANAEIGRDNSKGKEFWRYDGGKGVEIVQKLDGTQTVSSWFTSGRLAGALRKREETTDGKTKTIYQASYDEEGRLFREILENGEVNTFAYSDGNRKKSSTRIRDGEPVYTAEYTDGRISTVRSADGKTLEYFYDEKGRERKLLIDGRIHSKKEYAPDGSWEKEIVFDDGGSTPSRTFYREFDALGRVALDRITEHSGNYPEINKRYFYDALGQLEKQIDSQQGTIMYSDGAEGKRVAKIFK